LGKKKNCAKYWEGKRREEGKNIFSFGGSRGKRKRG